jgi:Fur family ferric uptake transcriptional regulator
MKTKPSKTMKTAIPTGNRDTKQRSAIRSVFMRCKRPLSPKELLKEASRQIPQLGIATVYRNIKSMIEKKELVAIEIPGEAPRYALPGNETHSIFVCDRTGRVFFLDDFAGRCVVRDGSSRPGQPGSRGFFD